ncbi:IS6-like element ISClte3 family transposase [Clostridium tetani]|uniref:Transposase n=1 Tax=Clostridium tetani (strain Massachusetts / E88) TaxID=212717 RepID=Q898Q4_CLOTE|nr:IS6-like element ISClte3 family transposase [Clostridium tetani]AAO35025.1 transposase [Clostridium tetani E88]KGI40818.1 integrase [Clostridium tetani]KGI44294.1 integrase [Clostridium tetani]KHO38164.1 integrase [Clostridium tetani]KIG20446.1 integrase [Clostridium tetani]
MNKTKIKCPRCHSDKLYKFGFDKQANQKYQCQKCRPQFTHDSVNTQVHSKYPKCPRCGKATYLHHEYKYYNRYKCSNRKCNHIIVKNHTTCIDSSSSDLVTGSLNMKGMRFPLHIILTALTLYFLNNSSTRAISRFLKMNSNIKVSHVTIANWTNSFAPFFKNKAESFKESLDLQSDDWHADETVVFINGERYYLWLAIDSETRFILAFHLTKSRESDSAFSLINNASTYDAPENFITDRLPSYTQATATLLKNTTHIPVAPMPSDISNNLIESFNKTFKTWYKAKKGFNSFEKANNLVYLFILQYNFIRPHGSLNDFTPAEVTGFKTTELDKNTWFTAV